MTADLDLTIKEIAEALGGVHPNSLLKKAKRQNWAHYKKQIGGGSLTNFYPFRTLPQKIQLKIAETCQGELLRRIGMAKDLDEKVRTVLTPRIIKLIGEDARTLPDVPAHLREGETSAPSLPVIKEIPVERLTEKVIKTGLKKAEWIEWYSKHKKSMQIPEIEKILNRLKMEGRTDVPSIRTLQHWGKMKKIGGMSGLADKRFRAGRPRKITPEMEGKLYGHLYMGETRPCRLHEFVNFHFPDNRVCESTVKEWLRRKKKEYPQYMTALMKGVGEWKNKYQVAFGNMHDWKNLGLNKVWEFDGHKIDVMCLDGRYHLQAGIDVASRWVEVVVTKTLTKEAVGALLRQMVVRLGAPDGIRFDQGSEYKNKYFDWAVKELEIMKMPAEPYSGEQKPFIERYFGTVSRDFFETLPGYIGHNVAEAQKIRERVSYERRKELEKAGDKEKADQELFRVALTGTQLAEATQQYLRVYRDTKHSALGCSPYEKHMELLPDTIRRPCRETLDILLLYHRDSIVTSKGIKFKEDGMEKVFTASEMIDYIGEEVVLKSDGVDLGKVYVFSREGKYLFAATDKAIDTDTVNEIRNKQKKQIHTLLDNAAETARRITEEHGNVYRKIIEKKDEGLPEKEAEILEEINSRTVEYQPANINEALIEIPPQKSALLYNDEDEKEPEDWRLDIFKGLEAKKERGEKLTKQEIETMEYAKNNIATVKLYLEKKEAAKLQKIQEQKKIQEQEESL